MNVIFVKWGTKYSSDDVNALYNNLIEYNSKYSSNANETHYSAIISGALMGILFRRRIMAVK